MTSPLAYYITAHGYGHGVRSCDILRALLTERPDLPVIVVTDLPRPFLEHRIDRAGWTLRPGRFDAGMVQLDSVRVDLDATARELHALLATWSDLLNAEARWLDQHHVAAVVADIPAIPLAAAARAGCPSLAIGNFGWDWIYHSLRDQSAGFAPAAEAFAAAYGEADLLLRLPFAEPMAAFPHRIDIPLVSRPGQPRRDEMIRLTGASPDKTWVLLSFSTLDWDAEALAAVSAISDTEFFTVLPLHWSAPNIHAIDRHDVSYTDVLASVDVVITKPGYGVLSECAVNQKPIIYTEREDFAEYPVLVEAVHRHLRHVHIPGTDLYAGNLRPSLDLIRTAPPPREEIASDRGRAAVREILARLDPNLS